MNKVNVAILGATGAVGREMLKVLAERKFPVNKLKALASSRSAGMELPFGKGTVVVEEATDASFEGVDIVLGAAQNPLAKQFAPAIVKAGAVFVDNSSAFRMDDSVPLVVPEINPEDVKKHHGIIANPNCSTIITPRSSFCSGSMSRFSGFLPVVDPIIISTIFLMSKTSETHTHIFNSKLVWTFSSLNTYWANVVFPSPPIPTIDMNETLSSTSKSNNRSMMACFSFSLPITFSSGTKE